MECLDCSGHAIAFETHMLQECLALKRLHNMASDVSLIVEA